MSPASLYYILLFLSSHEGGISSQPTANYHTITTTKWRGATAWPSSWFPHVLNVATYFLLFQSTIPLWDWPGAMLGCKADIPVASLDLWSCIRSSVCAIKGRKRKKKKQLQQSEAWRITGFHQPQESVVRIQKEVFCICVFGPWPLTRTSESARGQQPTVWQRWESSVLFPYWLPEWAFFFFFFCRVQQHLCKVCGIITFKVESVRVAQ